MTTAIWEWSFLGNSVRTWALAFLVTCSVLTALWLAQHIFLPRLARLTIGTRNGLDNVINGAIAKPRFWFLAILAVYAGSLVLTLPRNMAAWAGAIALIAFLIQVGLQADTLITFWLTRYRKEHENGEDVTTMSAVGFVVRLALYSLIALIALDNLPNVNVTSLIASLGVGGIAVALAVQNILADLLASLSIALDRPFVIGDYIVVDDHSGTVEHIGLKTTRVRSLSGEQLIIANNDLLKSRIRNYKRMQERRVVFTIRVTYQTPYDRLVRIPTMIREIIEAQPQTRFDRAHFSTYGDFSLDFEIVYYMLDPNYTLYMDTQQAINLALFRRFAEEGIDFAYPTQVLYTKKVG